jgi:hypothetical protein
LVLLPLLVGTATFFYVRATSGPQVEGTLELTLPTGGTTGASDALIANFLSVAEGSSVRSALSDHFNVSRGDIGGHLTATRVDNTGTSVRVAYTSDTSKNVAAIVTADAKQALHALLDPDIAAAKATRTHLLAHYAAIGNSPSSQTPTTPQGLTTPQLIQREQGLILDQVGALNQQISLATAERKAAVSAASDQTAVTLTRTSANSIALKTTLLNAGIALFAAIILLVAYDTVRPSGSSWDGQGARRDAGSQRPWPTEYSAQSELGEEAGEPGWFEEPDHPHLPEAPEVDQNDMDQHGRAGVS